MKIAILHFRAGETDGVSLEMDKWKKACVQLGHQCFIVAGTGGDFSDPCMDFRGSKIEEFFRNAFDKLTISESDLQKNCYQLRDLCKKYLLQVFSQISPDVLIVNNIFSLPLNLPLALALIEILQENPQIKCIGFHHDFYWEREIYHPTTSWIIEQLEQYFPAKTFVKHLVINSIAQDSLQRQKNLESTIVDNYFDFSEVTFGQDDYNKNLRSTLNIAPDDIVALHATRIVKRKGIEFAIQACAEIQKQLPKHVGNKLYNDQKISESSQVYMVFPGLNEDSPYMQHIQNVAQDYNVKALFVPELCTHQRSADTYSLWDFYVAADIVTYTSTYEGWGNQLVEAIAAKKPVVLFEYPVFKSNIASLGFRLFSLGDLYETQGKTISIEQQRVSDTIEKLWDVLLDPQKYQAMTDYNQGIAEKELSIAALQSRIQEILSQL